MDNTRFQQKRAYFVAADNSPQRADEIVGEKNVDLKNWRLYSSCDDLVLKESLLIVALG